ncbi:histone-like nucleoid-structuring protein Lsr2 [Amycolatopsis sp. cmx-4-61]|uniref:Lsr2 dimerization domain-containing protein n=1 Tax=Amycolatopsis sp. cmx-4-61 TaxID=2790937 RepID=UPI003979B697
MAKNTAVQVLDDLTGEPAAETVGFGLDGIDYDIDLSFANAEALRVLLQRYADAGRRTGGRKNRPRLVPGAKKTPAKTARAASDKTAATKTAPAKSAPAKAAPTKTASAKTASAQAKATSTKATATKATTAKTTGAKAESPKPARAKKAAEPKSTRAAARKVPTVTFSAAE